MRVDPKPYLESSLPHIALRQGPACTKLLKRISPNVAHEESPPQL